MKLKMKNVRWIRSLNVLVGFVLSFGCLLTGGILLNGMLETGNKFYGVFGLWNLTVYWWICVNIKNKPND